MGVTGIALAAGSIAGCGGDASPPGRPAPATGARSVPADHPPSTRRRFTPSRISAPRLEPGRLAIPETFVFRVAADPRHLVWATGPLEGEARETALVQRDVRSGRTATIARGIDPHYGLGSTAKWIVFARTAGTTRLQAMRHDGSHRIELARNLLAPFAVRGDSVGWAERTGAYDRVIVRDMATGREWVAATMARCRRARCHRIDSVTLADRGVAFTRVATAPDESEIVRRAFGGRRVRRLEIPGDPQPELVPSSAGALYHVLRRGWYRWDFGSTRPHRIALPVDPSASVLGYERGYTFLRTARGCRHSVIARRDRRPVGRIGGSPADLTAFAGAAREGTCVLLGALTWTGGQPITSWGVIPEASGHHHEASGLVGVVDVGAPLP